MGHAARLGMGSASPGTEEYDIISCSIAKRGSVVESLGFRGTRSHIKESVNLGTYTVGGTIVMEPRPDDLDNLLPRMLGGTESVDVFPLAEALPDFFVVIDKVADVFGYNNCKVARWTMRSSPGQNLQLTLEVEGKTESLPASFPDIAASLSVLQPYIHHQAVLTLDSTTRDVSNLEIACDNGLLTDQFRNSETRQHLTASDRIITLTCDNPFTADELDLNDIAVAGFAGSVVYTNGDRSLDLTFANLKAPARGPGIPGRTQEIPLRLELQAFQSGATKELVITNDPVA
jgi:hypothetical protein